MDLWEISPLDVQQYTQKNFPMLLSKKNWKIFGLITFFIFVVLAALSTTACDENGEGGLIFLLPMVAGFPWNFALSSTPGSYRPPSGCIQLTEVIIYFWIPISINVFIMMIIGNRKPVPVAFKNNDVKKDQ